MTENDPYMADLQHRVKRAHSAVPGGYDPAPDVWQRAKAQAHPHLNREEPIVNMTPTLSTPTASLPLLPANSRQVVAPFTNIAAILLMVAIMAFGGWFSMGQLNRPLPNPRFAALGMQEVDAGNGVCDVEPLTVDEAILILTDPMGSLVPDLHDPVAMGYPAELFGRRQVTERDPFMYVFNLQHIASMAQEMHEPQFEEAQPIVNEFLDCMYFGTMGQMWRLMDPITVQYRLHTTLPTLVSEEEARMLLPDILAQPATFALVESISGPTVLGLRVNPDVTQSRYWAGSGFYGFGSWAVSPLQFLDENGEVAMEPDLYGNLITDPEKSAEFAINIVYGQSVLDMQWYVIDIYFPFNVRSGQ